MTATTATSPRPFRFAAGGEGNKEEGGVRKFVKLAQDAEELGYDTFAIPDRIGQQVGPLAALGALAVSTNTIRLATSMLAVPYRHPALLAKELTTIDVLSKGRLEVGLGVGAFKEDFDALGVPFEAAGTRVNRFAEAFAVLDKLLRGEAVTAAGEAYQLTAVQGYPRPRQGPRPPIAMGAGGDRMLAFAAQHADIISVAPASTAEGKLRVTDMSLENVTSRVETIRKAAGDRFDAIELSWTIATIVVTDDRQRIAEVALEAIKRGLSPNIEKAEEVTVDDILTSPYLAFGTFEEIADQVRSVRAATGMSYVGVFPTQMEAFAPVMEQLRGE